MKRNHYRALFGSTVGLMVVAIAIAMVSSSSAQAPEELVSYPDWIFTNAEICRFALP